MDKETLFVVDEVGERTVVRFDDRHSYFEAFRGLMADAIASEARHQLEELASQHQCEVLAIDVSAADHLPSSFLGALIALSRGGPRIELRHLSASAREAMEVTNLDRFFTIGE